MTVNVSTCSVGECERPPRRKRGGMCGMHYQRWRKHGDPTAGARRPRATCSVEDCAAFVEGRGLCHLHYERWKRNGDPLVLQDLHTAIPGVTRRKHTSGYVLVYDPAHPLARRDGCVMEHRRVVHDAGITIPDGWHVHHINGDKTDNRLENLAVIDPSEHARHHSHEANAARWGNRGATPAGEQR